MLYDNPDNLFVAGFIGSPPMNMAEATILEDGATLRASARRASGCASTPSSWPPSRHCAAYIGRDVALGVRSEDLSEPGPRNDVPEDQRLRSTAKLTEALGSEIVVHFVLDAPPVRDRGHQGAEGRLGPQRRHRHRHR